MSYPTLQRLMQAASALEDRVQELSYIFVAHPGDGRPGELALPNCTICGKTGHRADVHPRLVGEIFHLLARIDEITRELETVQQELQVERENAAYWREQAFTLSAELNRLRHQLDMTAVHARPTRP